MFWIDHVGLGWYDDWWWYWNDMGMMWGRLWSASLQALIGVAGISGKHHHGMKNDFTWVGNLSCTGCAANIRSHKLTAHVWSICLTRDSDYGLVAGPMRAPLPWCAALPGLRLSTTYTSGLKTAFGLQNDHPPSPSIAIHRHPSPSIAIPQGWFPGKRSKISAMAAFSGLFIPERPPELRSILMPQSNSCYRHMTEITSFPATYRKSKKPQFPFMWGSPQSGMPSKADIAWDQPNRTSWHCSQGSQKTTDLVPCMKMSRHFMTVWPFPLKQTPRVFLRSHAPWPVADTSYAAEPTQRCHSGLEAWREEMNLKSLEIRERNLQNPECQLIHLFHLNTLWRFVRYSWALVLG